MADAATAVVVVLIGYALAYAYYWPKALPQNLSERNALARAGKTFLVNKYYLDHLYTDVVVGGIKGPVARAAYWVNQNVIDGVLNGVGRGAKVAGQVHVCSTSIRRESTARSTESPSAPARSVKRPASCRPDVCSSTR